MKAIVKLYGDWEKSYAFLPRWLTYMIETNVGSVFNLQYNECFEGNSLCTDKVVFHRIFWTFHQCTKAFKYCKPILQIDGTHLYGKYRGTLLIATSQDGDGYVLPIAFVVVPPDERSNYWWWFLSLLRDHVTQRRDIALISDRHASIIKAFSEHPSWQPPNAYHMFCIRHIGSNFNTRFKNVELKKTVMKLEYTCSKINFDRRYDDFIATSPEIAAWMDRIPLWQWCRAYDEEGRIFGHMTTNLSECVNKLLRGARNLPITALVKMTSSRLVEYFVERRDKIQKEMAKGRRISKKVEEALQKNDELSGGYIVRIYDRDLQLFEVDDANGETMRVDLIRQKCQCGRFTARRYPATSS